MARETLFLQAPPAAVRRALKSPPAPGMAKHGFHVVELRAADNTAGEGGRTVLVYEHDHDEASHQAHVAQVVARAAIAEQEIIDALMDPS